MKNKIIQYFGILIAVFFATGCQNFDEPPFGDYPLDPPIITLNSPNAGGSTVIRSSDPTAPITFNFQVEDDIEISNITVNVDGIDLANMSQFTNVKKVLVDDLVYDASTGTHTLTITATDSDDKVVTLSTTFVKEDTPPYNPTFAGEIFYMDFEGNYTDTASNIGATEVGTPGFAGEGRVGSDAYAGATDSYLTFPTNGLLGSEFSASFWYKLNAVPDRAGILVIGPPDDANPTAPNNRKSGFRFFREARGGKQSFRLNIGNGTSDDTAIPDVAFDLEDGADWVHFTFTITQTMAVIYMNGDIIAEKDITGLDWTGCDILSIMSGAPRFIEWGHKSDLSYIDELRIFDVALTQSDVTNIIAQTDKTFDMSFDGSFTESVSQTDATVVGSPGFAGEAKVGTDAYAGATDSYLTFPTEGLLSEEFSTTFWYKVNASPDRAGIIVISPVNETNPDLNNLNSGFHLFREGGADEQTIKASVGTGTAQIWNNGGIIDVAAGEWVHVALTISNSESKIYLNGVLKNTSTVTGGVDWTGTDIVSIMSGAPRFIEWNHKSDSSYMDELLFFNKALTKNEIQAIMAE
jgi:hypothetical protein